MEKLYEGKAKEVYSTEKADEYIIRYKDDATAGNGEKKATIAGKGELSSSGDGGPATSASIKYPEGLFLTSSGLLVITDRTDRIRVVYAATAAPTVAPSVIPSAAPTVAPSISPTILPTIVPSVNPTTFPSFSSGIS